MTFLQFQRHRIALSRFRRIFLLYKSPSPSAKIVHLLFHAYLLEDLLVSGISLWMMLLGIWGSPILAHHHSLELFTRQYLFREVFGLAVSVLITILLQVSAAKLENDPPHFVRDQILARYDPPGIYG